MKNPIFSKIHYKLFAAYFAEFKNLKVEKIIEIFLFDNPRFNEELFNKEIEELKKLHNLND